MPTQSKPSVVLSPRSTKSPRTQPTRRWFLPYLRGLSSVTRSTPVTSDERAQRTRFAAISRAVNTRRKDLAHVAEDLAAFNAQKDTAGGYKTMRQYLWHICAAEING